MGAVFLIPLIFKLRLPQQAELSNIPWFCLSRPAAQILQVALVVLFPQLELCLERNQQLKAKQQNPERLHLLPKASQSHEFLTLGGNKPKLLLANQIQVGGKLELGLEKN